MGAANLNRWRRIDSLYLSVLRFRVAGRMLASSCASPCTEGGLFTTHGSPPWSGGNPGRVTSWGGGSLHGGLEVPACRCHLPWHPWGSKGLPAAFVFQWVSTLWVFLKALWTFLTPGAGLLSVQTERVGTPRRKEGDRDGDGGETGAAHLWTLDERK